MKKKSTTNTTSRTGAFIKNSASLFFYQGVVLISGFITAGNAQLLRLGNKHGLVSSVAQFVSYLILVEAGLSATTVYSLYKPLADKDTAAISSVVTAAKKFYYKSGWLFLALISLLAVAYPLFIQIPDKMGYIDILLLVFISGVGGVMHFFTLAKYRALLTADQKTYILGLSSTCYTITNVVIITVLAALRI